MMLSFARQSWTRERYPLVDDGHGNEVPDLNETPESLTITGCSIQPGPPTDVLGDRDAALISWTIYQPPGSDVIHTDFGRIGGQLYRVHGHPQQWTSPTGAVSNDVVLLERWEG